MVEIMAAIGTMFQFAVPGRAQASLVVYDVRGRRVKTVMQQQVNAGEHFYAWNGRDERGTEVATGTYFARLEVEGANSSQTVTRKVTLVR